LLNFCQHIGNTCEAQLWKIRNRKIVSFTEIKKWNEKMKWKKIWLLFPFKWWPRYIFVKKHLRSYNFSVKKPFCQITFRSNDLSVKWPFGQKSSLQITVDQITFRTNSLSINLLFFKYYFRSNDHFPKNFGKMSFGKNKFGQMTFSEI
jgi:hypothetical protein